MRATRPDADLSAKSTRQLRFAATAARNGGPREDQPSATGAKPGSGCDSQWMTRAGASATAASAVPNHPPAARKALLAHLSDVAMSRPTSTAASIECQPPASTVCARAPCIPKLTDTRQSASHEKHTMATSEHTNHRPTKRADQRGRDVRTNRPRPISRSNSALPRTSAVTIASSPRFEREMSPGTAAKLRPDDLSSSRNAKHATGTGNSRAKCRRRLPLSTTKGYPPSDRLAAASMAIVAAAHVPVPC
jgi:hypothetical protein